MAEDVRNNDKGKGRARIEEENPSANPPSQDTSNGFVSRVANSAAGLARDLVGSSGGHGVLGDLSSSSAVQGKSGRTGGPAVSSQAAELAYRPGAGRGFATTSTDRDGQIGSEGQGLRSVDDVRRQQVDVEFDAFARDGGEGRLLHHGGPIRIIDLNTTTLPTTRAERRDILSLTQIDPLELSWQKSTTVNGTHLQQAEATDGASVLDLLTDPTFSPGADLYEIPQIDETIEQDASDLFGENFNSEETQIAASMKSTLPPKPVFGPIDTTHPHSFIFMGNDKPIDRVRDTVDRLSALASSPFHPSGDEATRVAEIEKLKEQLRHEWAAVSSNYSDEVWGDLAPQVNAVQEGVEEVIRDGAKPLNKQAVERLKMILAHIEPQAGALREKRTSLAPIQNAVNTKTTTTQDAAYTSSYNSQGTSSLPVWARRTIDHRAKPATINLPTPNIVATSIDQPGNQSTGYVCPNQECLATFPSNEQWAQHIKTTHVDLFQKNSPILVEGGPDWDAARRRLAGR